MKHFHLLTTTGRTDTMLKEASLTFRIPVFWKAIAIG